jgi:hypothetical protein
MSIWSFFNGKRAAADMRREALRSGQPSQELGTPPGVLCAGAGIPGHEQDAALCKLILDGVAHDRRALVVLRTGREIYVQANFKYEDKDLHEFKLVWPLWYLLRQKFFIDMVDRRGAEKIIFLDQDLKDELASCPELTDIVGLFKLVRRRTLAPTG